MGITVFEEAMIILAMAFFLGEVVSGFLAKTKEMRLENVGCCRSELEEKRIFCEDLLCGDGSEIPAEGYLILCHTN